MNRSHAVLRHILAALAIIVALAWMPARPAHADDLSADKSQMIRALLPTVVNISVKKDTSANPSVSADAVAPDANATQNIKSYVGSGFVIDPSGLIVTNYHVVQDAFEITVTFSDNTKLTGRTLSASRLADLALVKVETNHKLTAAHWGNSDALHVGDQVFAMGDPFGIGLSVSAGIVSGLNRNIQDSPYDDFIQTDATINHGNSGGPLFDMQGKVVGVNSTIISPTTGSAGLGFAIPASSAHFVIDQLRTYGWVNPGWVGVKLQLVTPDIADAIGMAQPEGSILSWVLPNGPAKRAGLAIGDVILRINGVTPSDDRALLRDIASTTVGQTITLLVRHDGQQRKVPVTVQSWPRNQWDALDAPQLVRRPKINVSANLGLSLSTIAPADRSKMGMENGLNGVLVAKVTPDSDAANRGLANGDVILRVQDKPVATPEDVRSGIAAARAEKREFVLLLILPKVRPIPGPKWLALQVSTAGG